jgi:hypothetical protein
MEPMANWRDKQETGGIAALCDKYLGGRGHMAGGGLGTGRVVRWGWRGGRGPSLRLERAVLTWPCAHEGRLRNVVQERSRHLCVSVPESLCSPK